MLRPEGPSEDEKQSVPNRMLPLRAIIALSVALGIHPNVLTLIGVLINVGAACALDIRLLGRITLHRWLAPV